MLGPQQPNLFTGLQVIKEDSFKKQKIHYYSRGTLYTLILCLVDNYRLAKWKAATDLSWLIYCGHCRKQKKFWKWWIFLAKIVELPLTVSVIHLCFRTNKAIIKYLVKSDKKQSATTEVNFWIGSKLMNFIHFRS